MTKTTAVNLEAALHDPAAQFQSPADVARNLELTRVQKLKILQQWELDARALATAEEEGMAGGERSRLQQVRAALESLEAPSSTGEGVPSKNGG